MQFAGGCSQGISGLTALRPKLSLLLLYMSCALSGSWRQPIFWLCKHQQIQWMTLLKTHTSGVASRSGVPRSKYPSILDLCIRPISVMTRTTNHQIQPYRTHRARKANYVKSLEDEVAQLRKQNSEFSTAIRQYQSILAQNRIPDCISTTRPPPPGEQQPARDRLPTSHSVEEARGLQKMHGRYPSSNLSASSTLSASRSVPMHSHELSQSDMNFVLGLEQPYLPHHYADESSDYSHSPSPDDGGSGATTGGYQSMVSSPVLRRSRAYRFSELAERASPDAQWGVVPSGPELEASLRFARDLRLGEADVSSGQPWQLMAPHPRLVSWSL